MADSRRLAKYKIPHVRNGLTDRNEICQDDPLNPEPYRQLKIAKFENPRRRTAAILKIKNGHMSVTDCPIVTKFGTMMHIDPENRTRS